ncbi:MAG TPA: ATP-binding protein [Candidatus Competibacter sp.]|mgnify:CR=1 FL=1|nr:ATP-binding protein [Candidatus Competibacter sp.]
MSSEQDCEELRKEVARLDKINRVLMRRVERSMELSGDAFALFQAATVLENQVRERTAAYVAALEELKQSNEQLRCAKEEAEAASKAKGEFLATMSHEIRTPMNGVFGMTELLLNTPLKEQQRQYVTTIQHSAQSLLSIINDILDFSKIEAGRLELEQIDFDLRALLQETIEIHLESSRRKRLRLNRRLANDLPTQIRGDPNRLRQILHNLIGNAVKFTDKGGISVVVSRETSWLEQNDARIGLRFEVIDTGIGIPDEAQQHIFEAFRQADGSTTRQFGGTGLGLAIARKLVRVMDGDMGVESKVGVGSTFWFRILVQPGAERLAQTDPDRSSEPAVSANPGGTTAAKPAAQLRVLLAEDNLVNQIVARSMLGLLGYHVTVVANGSEAVMAFANSRFDIILMDCQMPCMDGYQATSTIRQQEQSLDLPRLPIIGVTANAIVGDRERCLEAGMDDYLSKPFSLQGLRETLERALQRKQTSNPSPPKTTVSEPRRPASLDPTVLAHIRNLNPPAYPALLEELVGAYLRSSAEAIATLQAALAGDDRDVLGKTAHSLKSGSDNLGAVHLVELCKELELIGRGQSDADPTSVVTEIREEHRAVCEALQAELTKVTGATA